MIGKRFGQLVVISLAPRATSGNTRYNCRCDCGKSSTVTASHLRLGKTQSCGHLRAEAAARATIAATTHGMRNTNTYSVWNSMLNRCRNPKVPNYPSYGGRGITVCPQWYRFETFFADMGVCPQGLSIDRYPDVDGNYEPGNCRWATNAQQQRNKRNTIHLTHKGITKSLRDWEDDLGLPKEVIYGRIKNGWSPERAIEVPYQANKAHPR